MKDKTIINDNSQNKDNAIPMLGRGQTSTIIFQAGQEEKKEEPIENLGTYDLSGKSKEVKKTHLITIWASKIQELILLEVDHAIHGRSFILYRGFQRLNVPEDALKKDFDEVTNPGVQRALVTAHSELLANAIMVGATGEKREYEEEYLNAIVFMPGE